MGKERTKRVERDRERGGWWWWWCRGIMMTLLMRLGGYKVGGGAGCG